MPSISYREWLDIEFGPWLEEGPYRWLPTLSDLLEMLMEYGYDYTLSGWWEGDEKQYQMSRHVLRGLAWDSKASGILKDPELAAARLLERVLEK